MELNWSTFVLEIINFLVLVWVLKRFLYQPVLTVIVQRKARIDKALADAEARRRDAQSLLERYENRLAEWEQEKGRARAQLREELNAERAGLTATLLESLEEERQRARVLEERRLGEVMRRNEEVAVDQAARFAARLLSRIAGPEVERRLVAMVVEELAALPADRLRTFQDALTETDRSPTVVSAHPLDQEQRQELNRIFAQGSGRAVACDFTEDKALLAGLRITLGSWVLQANLQDELKFFSEGASHGG